MALEQSDWRQARKVGLIILGVFAAIFIAAVLLRKPGESMQPQALLDTCRTRYAQAHSRGDTVLADAWIPRPELQNGRGMLRCMDLVLPR